MILIFNCLLLLVIGNISITANITNNIADIIGNIGAIIGAEIPIILFVVVIV